MKHKLNMITRYIILLGFIFTILLTPVTTVIVSGTEAQKNQIDKEIKQTQANLTNTQNKKKSILDQVKEIENNLVSIDTEIEKLTDELNNINKKIKETEQEMQQIEEDKAEHYDALKLRMQDMYENSTTNYLELFLQSENFVDMFDKMYNVELMMEKDQEILEKLAGLEEELIAKKKQIEEERAAIQELKTKQENKRYEMDSSKSEKNNLMLQLSNEEKAYFQELTNLEEASKAIEAQIKGATKDSTIVFSGAQFTWPVPGYSRVSSEYGNRGGFYLQDGSYSKPQFHTGLDIPAPVGTNILAADGGKVITASYVNGYGYTVIIDHGSGITTLYGHNSQLVVKVGAIVTKGQIIAKCGSTGYSTGPHCHFEVRKNGSHVNPNTYLGRKV